MAFEKNPEKVIWEAARKIFLSRGLSGARMQDIADEAGINKALLHYYYRSKETLFGLIFEKELDEFVRNIETIFHSDAGFFEKIERLVAHDIDTFSRNPELPLFILNELSQQTACARQEMSLPDNNIHRLFRQLVKAEIDAGTIRPIDPDQLFIHLVSLTIFPFMARPMIRAMLAQDEPRYLEFLQERKKEICRFVFDSLATNPVEHIPQIIKQTSTYGT